ncbi:zinc finger, C3HC4 type (RING finger) domain-containing protein [Besnoitia besnoiti]|uniref:Zinc finger, C3HC4 type (RING finger) domain-containing protein n=1 Tax=Besnoitia besnoiti TaxID=94643 RepID=A0A2A9MKR5_BESBE|nr:zinc finger, C3HC4 type (RING finger) domain-containing protein [Besnoitia besnoiti]PFH36020.1 zinc finger, C3HC4 type (RING finger) domain-containing protein [Besnoitia besnoiti]
MFRPSLLLPSDEYRGSHMWQIGWMCSGVLFESGSVLLTAILAWCFAVLDVEKQVWATLPLPLCLFDASVLILSIRRLYLGQAWLLTSELRVRYLLVFSFLFRLLFSLTLSLVLLEVLALSVLPLPAFAAYGGGVLLNTRAQDGYTWVRLHVLDLVVFLTSLNVVLSSLAPSPWSSSSLLYPVFAVCIAFLALTLLLWYMVLTDPALRQDTLLRLAVNLLLHLSFSFFIFVVFLARFLDQRNARLFFDASHFFPPPLGAEANPRGAPPTPTSPARAPGLLSLLAFFLFAPARKHGVNSPFRTDFRPSVYPTAASSVSTLFSEAEGAVDPATVTATYWAVPLLFALLLAQILAGFCFVFLVASHTELRSPPHSPFLSDWSATAGPSPHSPLLAAARGAGSCRSDAETPPPLSRDMRVTLEKVGHHFYRILHSAAPPEAGPVERVSLLRDAFAPQGQGGKGGYAHDPRGDRVGGETAGKPAERSRAVPTGDPVDACQTPRGGSEEKESSHACRGAGGNVYAVAVDLQRAGCESGFDCSGPDDVPGVDGGEEKTRAQKGMLCGQGGGARQEGNSPGASPTQNLVQRRRPIEPERGGTQRPRRLAVRSTSMPNKGFVKRSRLQGGAAAQGTTTKLKQAPFLQRSGPRWPFSTRADVSRERMSASQGTEEDRSSTPPDEREISFEDATSQLLHLEGCDGPGEVAPLRPKGPGAFRSAAFEAEGGNLGMDAAGGTEASWMLRDTADGVPATPQERDEVARTETMSGGGARMRDTGRREDDAEREGEECGSDGDANIAASCAYAATPGRASGADRGPRAAASRRWVSRLDHLSPHGSAAEARTESNSGELPLQRRPGAGAPEAQEARGANGDRAVAAPEGLSHAGPVEGGQSEEGDSCIICYQNHPNAVLLYCGHGGLCFRCAQTCFHRNGRCPTCRQAVKGVVELQEDASDSSERPEVDLEEGEQQASNGRHRREGRRNVITATVKDVRRS